MQTRYGLRQPVQMPARYWHGRGIAREVMVSDISPRGCRMQERFSSLRIGSAISIQIGSGEPIRAQVRWHDRGGVVGVQFLRTIDPAAMTGHPGT